jgi:hypothetical protein
MHPDGTVYHRYGSRGPDDADAWLRLSSLARLLRDTLSEHQAYDHKPSPPAAQAPEPALDLPALQRKIAAGQRIDCVHCHMVNDARFAESWLAKTWSREQAFVFPHSTRIGLTLDAEHQARITAVAQGSAAAAAGMQPGDELLAVGVQPSVRTLADLQWALHHTPETKGPLPVAFLRRGERRRVELALPADWKHCPPEEYAWRPMKWNLSPRPGFGGKALDAAERRALGLGDAPFALRVQYLVDWGERAASGKAARAAGLRKGDVVVAFAGKRDFTGFDHFHAWIAMTRTAGEPTEFVVWRDGKEHVLRYTLPE